MEPERVTNAAGANEQLLYFTSSSLTADDRWLVFISDRDGVPNLFARDLVTGQEVRLSHNSEGALKSYVYFDGIPDRGLGKASVSLDSERGMVYYLQGRRICRASLDGKVTVLAEYPEGQVTAFTHVSADGRFLCVPTTDSAALCGDEDALVAFASSGAAARSNVNPAANVRLSGRPKYDVDKRIRELGLSSWLRVYDTRDGRLVHCEPVPGAWVTHVQFSPQNSDWILYNNEWCSDSGIRRMWLWDGQKHRPLRDEADGRSRRDWTCHEMWERDGSAIIYHGKYANGLAYIGRVAPNGSNHVEIALPQGWDRYGHFTVGNPGQLVSDGYYCAGPDDTADICPWICQLQVDWTKATAEWHPLCRHDSSWDSQDSHPHPIYNHAVSAVFFTSDRSGKRAVYRCPVQ